MFYQKHAGNLFKASRISRKKSGILKIIPVYFVRNTLFRQFFTCREAVFLPFSYSNPVVFNLSKIFDTTKPNTIDLKRLITHQIQPKELFYKEENSKFSYFIDAFFDIVKTRADENTLLAQGLLLTILGNIFLLYKSFCVILW